MKMVTMELEMSNEDSYLHIHNDVLYIPPIMVDNIINSLKNGVSREEFISLFMYNETVKDGTYIECNMLCESYDTFNINDIIDCTLCINDVVFEGSETIKLDLTIHADIKLYECRAIEFDIHGNFNICDKVEYKTILKSSNDVYISTHESLNTMIELVDSDDDILTTFNKASNDRLTSYKVSNREIKYITRNCKESE